LLAGQPDNGGHARDRDKEMDKIDDAMHAFYLCGKGGIVNDKGRRCVYLALLALFEVAHDMFMVRCDASS